MKFSDVIDEILLTVTPLRRIGTRDAHKRYLSHIRESLGDTLIESFSRKEYLKWINNLRASKVGVRETFDDYTKFFNIISNFAYQHKYITHLIKYPTTDCKDRDKAGRAYSRHELKALWNASAGDINTKTQLILALECFMRLRESLHLTWDRVDLADRKITLRKQDVKTGTKCGRGRVIPLSENAFEYLSELSKSAKTEWVFPNPRKNGPVNENRRSWARVKRLARIRGRARWHDLRHTALSISAIDKNVNLANLSLVAGVSVRTIQRIYLHGEIDQLRDVTKAIDIKKIA